MTEETNYTPNNKVSLGGYVDSEQNFSHELSVSKTVAIGNSILNVKNKPSGLFFYYTHIRIY
ncbi:MAG: hypothetical protein HFE48_03780 [Clostridia bacterium]|nr:hypothetical protein [Clostridia bacterium]